ncbi:DNA primase [bacterium]|nr:DNA primase [bacterium]
MLEKTGFISKDQKEQILKSVDIVQLIGGYVPLKPAGKNYIGLCPFHQEKTPSFTVSPTHQNYKCYGCGEFGDAIRFVMEIENYPFKEALQFLADRTGIEIQILSQKKPDSSVQPDISNCLQRAFDFFQKNLVKAAEESPIRRYIASRQISNQSIDVFQLGYIGPGWTQLNDFLKTRKVKTEVQEKAGLIKKGENGRYYDRLRDRLIFPIRDFQGKILGFAGRAVGDGKPKYLNPPETDLYKKSSVLYGIYEARDSIRKNRSAIVVEGYLDVIRLHEESWTEAIATCGTALTVEHIRMLKRLGAENVILLFDGDSAGISAAEKSAELFLENEIDSRVMILPDGLDPDDYFKTYSRDDFKMLLDQSRFDYQFIIDRTKERIDGTGIEFQKKAVAGILQIANKIKDTIKKELFISKMAADFRIERSILNQFAKIETDSRTVHTTDQHTLSRSPVSFNKSELPEVKFLQYLITHPQSITLARKYVDADDFTHKDLLRLFTRFLALSDEEFVSLKPQEFPEFFVEFNTLIMYLLQYQIEYRGPAVQRKRDFKDARDTEMVSLQEASECQISSFSEKSLKFLIRRLKKKRNHAEIEKLYHVRGEQARTTVMQLAEKRKRNISV